MVTKIQNITTYCNCPVHLTTTIHWQRSERLWGNHYMHFKGTSVLLYASRWFPHRRSDGCQCIVAIHVRWTGQLSLGLPYAINLPYQTNLSSFQFVCIQGHHSAIKITNLQCIVIVYCTLTQQISSDT